jgi:hypothetical protein
MAFDPQSGFCIEYKKVKGCEHFYDHLDGKSDIVFKAVDVRAFKPDDAPAAAQVAKGSSKNFFNFAQKY